MLQVLEILQAFGDAERQQEDLQHDAATDHAEDQCDEREQHCLVTRTDGWGRNASDSKNEMKNSIVMRHKKIAQRGPAGVKKPRT